MMARFTASLCIVALAVSRAFSFDWPVEGGAFAWGFGASRDGFLKGVEFTGTSAPVRAAESGELCFAASGLSLPGGYPIEGGSIAALSSDRGLLSVYVGLDGGSLSRYLKAVKAGNVLGRLPRTEGPRGFRYFVFDAKERRFLNPLSVMPALRDDVPPTIRSIVLSGDGGEIKLEQGKALRQGSYYIVVDAIDLTPAGRPGAPFELTVTIDGSLKSRVVYDAAWAVDGSPKLFGTGVAAEPSFVSGGNRVRFGPFSFPRGKLSFSVSAVDFAGNKREQGYAVSIQ